MSRHLCRCWQVTLCDPIMVCEFPYSGDGRPACKLLYAYFTLLCTKNHLIASAYTFIYYLAYHEFVRKVHMKTKTKTKKAIEQNETKKHIHGLHTPNTRLLKVQTTDHKYTDSLTLAATPVRNR